MCVIKKQIIETDQSNFPQVQKELKAMFSVQS